MGAAQQIMVAQNISGGGSFVPTDIAGLQLWLAARTESYADNDPVPTATDRSGQGHNATQGTSAQQPTFKTGILNGQPVYRFDGTGDNLAGIATSNAARTLFLVVAKRTAADGNTEVAFSFADSINCVIFTNTGFFPQWGYYNPATAFGGTANTFSVVAVRYASDSSAQGYINGVAAGSAFDPDNTYTLGGNAFRIGATDSGPNNPDDIDVAEVLIYDTALSSGDMASVQTYLAGIYGL